MQSLKASRALRNPISWGIGGLAFALVIALVLAWIYYHPPGQGKFVTFYTTDAVSIGAGDTVRMAGITVGTIREVSLEPQRVRVRARIDNDAFVGDQSQVEVRMLTVVGGYYVNINSLGDRALNADSIPAERVTLPYNLVQALVDSTKITQNVNPKPINESLNDLQQGLQGTNVQTLSAIVNAGNTIMSTIDRQRGQVTRILDVSNEYVRNLTDYRGEMVQLIRKISILVQTLTLAGKGFADLIYGLGQVLDSLNPVMFFYENHRAEFIEKVRKYMSDTQSFVERDGVTVRVLQRVQNLFDRVLNAQNARPALLSTDLCIPVPGNVC